MWGIFVKKIWDELKSQNIFYYIIVFSIIVILIITSLGSYLYQFYYKTIYSDFLVSNDFHNKQNWNRKQNVLLLLLMNSIRRQLKPKRMLLKNSEPAILKEQNSKKKLSRTGRKRLSRKKEIRTETK